MGIALDKIDKINVVEYDWKEGVHDIGIIAEELQKVFPEAIGYKDGKVEGIKPLTMIGLLVKAIQELKEK